MPWWLFHRGGTAKGLGVTEDCGNGVLPHRDTEEHRGPQRTARSRVKDTTPRSDQRGVCSSSEKLLWSFSVALRAPPCLCDEKHPLVTRRSQANPETPSRRAVLSVAFAVAPESSSEAPAPNRDRRLFCLACQTRTGSARIFSSHSLGPLSWTLLPSLSTATVTGMFSTSNS